MYHARTVLDDFFREGTGEITEKRFRALKAQLDPLFCSGIPNDDFNLQKSLYNMAAVVWVGSHAWGGDGGAQAVTSTTATLRPTQDVCIAQ